jgi:hypothetical protein
MADDLIMPDSLAPAAILNGHYPNIDLVMVTWSNQMTQYVYKYVKHPGASAILNFDNMATRAVILNPTLTLLY